MDGLDAQDLLDDLDDSLKDLGESIRPISAKTIQDTATKLTVADKARLYVLTTYAIESLIFSYLKINGADPKDHPIRTELSRVRGYVQKIKQAQAAPVSNMALDKDAAQRFIKAALAGNDKYDEERAATQARERANAHKRFNEITERMERANEGSEGPPTATQDEEVPERKEKKKSKKRKSEAAEEDVQDGAEQKKKKSRKSKDKKSKKRSG